MKNNKLLPPLLLGIVALVFWQGATQIFSIPEYILPSPSKISIDLFENFFLLLNHTGITLLEALIGFIIANFCAILLSICIVFIPSLEKAIMPFAIALKTTPIVAIAPLLLIWLGTGMAPKIAASALICFFPSFVNSLKGFNSIQEGEDELFRVYGASKMQILIKLRFQRAAPYIFSALKISSSLSIVGAIVGEFVGANEGIGYIILTSSYYLNFVRMFSALVMTAISGIIFYFLISFFDKKLIFWLSSPVDEVGLESFSQKK